jgi:hypothetical protein
MKIIDEGLKLFLWEAAIPGVDMKTVLRSLRHFLSSTTGWAILIAAVGVATCLLPWVKVSSSGIAWLSQPTFNGIDIATRFSDPCWLAVAASGIFAALTLLLIVTFTTEPVPLWKAVVVFGSGIGVIVAVRLMLIWAYRDRPTTERDTIEGSVVAERPIQIYYTPQEGPYAALGCAAGLLMLGALQFRAVLFCGHRDVAPSTNRDSRL